MSSFPGRLYGDSAAIRTRIADIFLDQPRRNTHLHFYLLLDNIMVAPL